MNTVRNCHNFRTDQNAYTPRTRLVQYGTRTPNQLLVYEVCTTFSWSPYFVNSQFEYLPYLACVN